MRKYFTHSNIIVMFMFSLTLSAYAGNAPQQIRATRIATNGPQGFIENQGQFVDQNREPRADLLYLLQRKGLKVQLMADRISFELYKTVRKNAFSEATGNTRYNDLDEEDRPIPAADYATSRIDLQFINANPHPEIVAEELLPDYLNYYLAYTPVDGITRVKQYNKIIYKDLFPKIDLVLIASPEQNPNASIAYDFIVHPGGNVNDIRYRYLGDHQQTLDKQGALNTLTQSGTITETIPESFTTDGYKALNPVAVSFDVSNNTVGFKASHFDSRQTLVIDPNVIWRTYCGGDSSEEGRGLTVDSMGNLELIGRSNSLNNIATSGAYQQTFAGDVDIIIEKYDSLGARIWGTYYGGTADDHGRGIVNDKFNNIYIGGHGASTTGIATPGSYQPNYAGGNGDDGYLAYFSKDGFRIWATYYGGDDNEIIRRLAIDNDGNVIMCGYTFSTSGIATPGAGQTVQGGDADLCVSKWTPSGALMWGSYLGGCCEDHGRSVTIDKDNNVYIDGSTSSPGIATPGVSRTTLADKQDFLLGKFTNDGQIAWVSYWGGDLEDRGRGVFVDSSSHYVYFMGYTASDTGIATPGAYQDHWIENYDNNGDPLHDMVVMKWTLDGQIVWSTYLGGEQDDRGRAITMIGDNEVYISGSTQSTDSIATPDAFQPTFGGPKNDMFLEIWDSNGIRTYGSYMGGDDDDDNLALAIDDKHQNIFLIGTSATNNFATPGTGQTTYGGDDDAFLVRIQVHIPAYDPVVTFTYANVPCTDGQVAFTNLTANADSYSWDFGDGNTSSVISPAYTYATTGNYTVTLSATNSATGVTKQLSIPITVENLIATAAITPLGSTTFCEGDSVVLQANTGNGYTYKWKLGPSTISGATNDTYTATQAGDYKVVVTVSAGCSATSSKVTVTVNPVPTATIDEGPEVTTCSGTTTTLHANSDPDFTYQWLSNGVPVPGATSSTLDVSTAEEFSVIETNDCGSDTSSITSVILNAPPLATVSANGPISFCEGGTVTLMASTDNGTSYQWQQDGADLPGASSDSYEANLSGSYDVVITNDSGCSATSNAIAVTVNALPTVIPSASALSVCLHDSVALSASGAVSYIWQPGNLSGSSVNVSPDVNTTYTVTGTDANGCANDSSISISVLGLPAIALGNDTTICDTANFVLDAGSGFVSYLWSTGATTQTLSISSSGTYWVSVQNADGCINGDTIQIEVTICDNVEELLSQTRLQIFPNPTNGSFTITLENPSGEKVFADLMNVLGQSQLNLINGVAVKSFSKVISAHTLSAGIYYVHVAVGDKVFTQKLIIE